MLPLRAVRRLPGHNVAMAELIADLFLSLDGFAAGVDVGPFFGYGGPELDGWVRDQLSRPQVTVMGRVTYEALAQISSSATDEASTRMTGQPKVVFSNTLSEPLTWPNTRLIRGDLGDGMRALKRDSPDPLRSIGSLSLVRSLLDLGLVDRLRIAMFPLVLADAGFEPAFAGYHRADLQLTGTRVLDSRIIMLDYRPTAPAM
jgi:dihydrofolate reductase